MRQGQQTRDPHGRIADLPPSWRVQASRPAEPPRLPIGSDMEIPGETSEEALTRRVHGALEQSLGHKRTVAVVLVDLGVADAEDLGEAAALLRRRLRRYDVVIALEAGQLAVCVSHLREASELTGVRDRIRDVLDGERYRRTWSEPRLGTAVHGGSQNARQLVHAARAALAALPA